MRILYKQLILNNVPPKKRIRVSRDWNCLYYKQDGNNVIVRELDLALAKQNFPFIGINVQMNSNVINVYFNIKVSDLKQELKRSIEFSKKRKLFFSLMNKCYWGSVHDYLSNMILEMFRDAMNMDTDVFDKTNIDLNYNHHNNIEWIHHLEKKSKMMYYYAKNILPISKKMYIDTLRGKITLKNQKNQKNATNIKGGILINNVDYSWVNDFASYHHYNNKKSVKTNYIKTSASMFICDEQLCELYKKKVLSVNDGSKVIIINKKNHKKTNYETISSADFVIVSPNYLISKKYTNLWKPYKLNEDDSIQEIFNEIRYDYINQPNIDKYNNPLLNMFWWQRLIVDDYSINEMAHNENLCNIIMAIKAKNRWIQIKKFPVVMDDIKMYFSFLHDDSKLNYPLYDFDNEINTPDNVIKINSESTLSTGYRKPTVESFHVSMDETESAIYHACTKRNVDPDLFLETLNKLNIQKRSDSVECAICYEHCEDSIRTACGHSFCTKCFFINRIYRKECSLCKRNINMDKITRLCSGIAGSKNKVVIDYLRKSSEETIVCNRGNNNYLRSFFKDANILFIDESELYNVDKPEQIIFMYRTKKQDYLHLDCNVVEIVNVGVSFGM